MSQATDLLNSLTDDQISAYSSNAGEEPHIVIGNDRFITVPESLKRIAVQYDHNVETVTFDCPRYWDDLDMRRSGNAHLQPLSSTYPFSILMHVYAEISPLHSLSFW